MSTVKIAPDTLEFKTPLVAESTDYIEITNESDEAVAFKVKTTAPKLYCVRPTAGKIDAGESTKIEIIFLGLAEEPEKDSKCKDKFLVLTLPAPYDLDGKSVSELWTSLEAEFKKSMISKKIKVAYVEGPAEPQEKQQVQEDEPILATSTQQPTQQKEEVPTPVVQETKPIVAPVPIPAAVPVPEVAPVPIAAPITETKPAIPRQEEPIVEKSAPVSTSSNEKASSPVANYDAPLAKEQPTDSTTSNSNILLLIAIVIFLLAWLYY
ncbi:phosphatidylinositol-binding protein scs2 [Maudiozyma exigua]|uniref:Phosphatidylinositol-binding protein scs2 n=1 Tax=Maudiozyma exigua TaxID=34358 RepID=A0A9P7BAE8_MAUEX|nr:phosphatidylinositol-binding protein scs2 [Kazachstania exigua]